MTLAHYKTSIDVLAMYILSYETKNFTRYQSAFQKDITHTWSYNLNEE